MREAGGGWGAYWRPSEMVGDNQVKNVPGEETSLQRSGRQLQHGVSKGPVARTGRWVRTAGGGESGAGSVS